MKKRKLWKAISAALSAVLLATSVPSAAFAAVPAKTADVQTKAADENELKLWYDEKAPDSYDGWEKWSLPLGNSGIGASVFGGITQERIHLHPATPARQNLSVQSWSASVMMQVRMVMVIT